jgi:hypothetical protein
VRTSPNQENAHSSGKRFEPIGRLNAARGAGLVVSDEMRRTLFAAVREFALRHEAAQNHVRSHVGNRETSGLVTLMSDSPSGRCGHPESPVTWAEGFSLSAW